MSICSWVEQCSEEALAEMCCLQHRQREEGFSALIALYLPWIDRKVAGWQRQNFDTEELRQEAMIALCRAAQQYDGSRGVPFRVFAVRCMENAIKNALQRQSTQKANLLRLAVPMEHADSEVLVRTQDDPEQIYAAREAYAALLREVETSLSELEKNVLFYYLEGNGYDKISQRLCVSFKTVDNALQRIRRKLKTVYQKREG